MTSNETSARSRSSRLPEPGDIVGAYEIERELGRGGMGVVLQARHRVLGRRVALKMLLPELAASKDMAARFAREGAAAARLNHPHAVDVTDVVNDQLGTPYLVMELLEGEDLADLIRRARKLDVEQTADILIPVVSAIAAAHDLGIVHRDLKPQNVFLAQRRQEVVPKVLDFGISKSIEESAKLTGTQALLGTPQYMSPEQARGAGFVDARSDQFSFGVLLYECLTGRCPFDGNTLFALLTQIISGVYPKASELVPGLPPALEDIIDRAMNKDPAQRFESMRALGVALLEFASMRVRLSFASDFGQISGKSPRSEGGLPTDGVGIRRVEVISQPAIVPPISQIVSAPGKAATPMEKAEPVIAGAAPAVSSHLSPKYVIPAGALVGALSAVLLTGYLSTRRQAERDAQPATVEAVAPGGGAGTSAQAAEPKGSGNTESATAAKPSEYKVDLTVEPSSAWIMVDGKAAGSGRLQTTFHVDGVEHQVRVGAPGHRLRVLKFTDAPPPTTSVVLEKAGERPVR